MGRGVLRRRRGYIAVEIKPAPARGAHRALPAAQADHRQGSSGSGDLPTRAVITIPFVKAHGARNDFLLTWRDRLPAGSDASQMAIAICDRHTGAGGDGWILLSAADGADCAIELWNSDGSRSEISGNGTRCAAALLISENR